MPRMSQSEYDAYLAKGRASLYRQDAPNKSEAETDEAKLHAQIRNECDRRGWYIAHHAMMHVPSTCPIGSPDFLIFADGGRVFAVECKSKTGKLSIEQLGAIAWAEKLNHKIHVVRSLTDFLSLIVEDVPTP